MFVFWLVFVGPVAVTPFMFGNSPRHHHTNAKQRTVSSLGSASLPTTTPQDNIFLSASPTKRKRLEYSDDSTSFSKQENVLQLPTMLPGGITPKALAWTLVIILALAETLVDPEDFLNGREIGYNLVDAAVPLTPTDLVAVTIGEVTAGAIAPFVSLAVVSFLTSTTVTRSLLTSQAVADADFLVAQAATQPFLVGLGLPLPLSKVLAGLLALVPSEVVKTAARSRDESARQEMDQALEEDQRANQPFAFLNLFHKENEVESVQLGNSVAIELFADLLKWLAYGVMCVKWESALAPLPHVMECAVFGILANVGSQAYMDVMDKYFLGETERYKVDSRTIHECKSEYLSQGICGATLFGLYEGVQEPATRLVSFFLDG